MISGQDGQPSPFCSLSQDVELGCLSIDAATALCFGYRGTYKSKQAIEARGESLILSNCSIPTQNVILCAIPNVCVALLSQGASTSYPLPLPYRDLGRRGSFMPRACHPCVICLVEKKDVFP